MQQAFNRKILLVFIFLWLFFAASAKAVCPVCVVAVGAGFGLSRWLGVDDIISSLWVGALLASLSIWTTIWLTKRNWNFKYSKIIIPASYYILIFAPLYYIDIIGHPLNKIFGVDKIIFGSAAGAIVFLLTLKLHNFLKTKNSGKSFFPYQKVILPVLILIIISLILWKTI